MHNAMKNILLCFTESCKDKWSFTEQISSA